MLQNTMRSIFLTALLLVAPPFQKLNDGLKRSSPRMVVDAGTFGSAVSALQNLDSRYFIAGGTCAAISHGITTPIDVVKTKIQANPKKYKKGMINAALDIVKEDGPGALAGGLGPTVVGYGIEGAMKFGVYEVMKKVFIELFGASNKAVAYLLASIVAGAVAAVLLCPMESTRIKIVTDPAYDNMGLLSALPKMMKDDGMFASFAGIYAMLAKQVPYTFGKQVSFDVFASVIYKFLHYIPAEFIKLIGEDNVKWVVSVFAAFGASLIACIFSQPGDMILTETFNKNKKQLAFVSGQKNDRRNADSPSKATERKVKLMNPTPVVQRSFAEVIAAIYDVGGYPAFFTGTGARIVHVGLIITSQLVIYDIVKQSLGLPATGSH